MEPMSLRDMVGAQSTGHAGSPGFSLISLQETLSVDSLFSREHGFNLGSFSASAAATHQLSHHGRETQQTLATFSFIPHAPESSVASLF